MGNPFSIPCDPCIERGLLCIEKRASYTRNLKKNLADLKNTMEVLMARRDDLLTRVTREEDRGLHRLAEVQVWLNKAQVTELKVNNLLHVGDNEVEKLCLCGFCSKSYTSSYRYGKSVFLTLREVEELKSDDFKDVAGPAQTSEVQERQLQPIIVGQETMLEEAWQHLKEDGVGIMGMYGMGGVGKTTLLKQLNNKFSKVRSGFDFVIWVVVSKELYVENIQDEIAEEVGLGGEEWKQKGKSQKAVGLYNFLRKKRFVFFLDDIWEKVDLADIGVPFPTTENNCKVAFTTRSQEVCSKMGVEEPMEVKCLGKDVAFDLFQKKVGQRTLESDPDIPELAIIVVEKCGGLPLALNVIGETMSCKTKKQEWLHAIDVLNSYASEFSGMEDKILPLLKYSYDDLKGEELRSCLLYCALFPEDDRIDNEKLIDYWICEGIIDGSESIERAENKGYEIIGSLVRASLLMEDGADKVYMHDVVREMALWVAYDLGEQKEAFIVHAGFRIHKVPKVKNWNNVRRMSLMKTNIQHLVGSPECLELTTLLMQETNLKNVSSEFFKSMSKLAVLDLSYNRELTCLPDEISKLVSLQYLNFLRTGISHLPKGLQALKKLIHLDLGFTRELSSIAGISSLHNLIVLKLRNSYFSWDVKTVEELETLEHLQVLTLSFVRKTPCLERYLSSHRLMNCTRELQMEDIDLISSGGILLPVTMEKLRYFWIRNCSIPEIKMEHNPRNLCFLSLSQVYIWECEALRELTFLMLAPNLKILHVRDCEVEDIIKKEKACEGGESRIVPFTKLTELWLTDLPKLKSIYWSPLPFPCLKQMTVIKCPNLKKLPLDSQSGPHCEDGLVIRYRERDWIEGVEWEDEATKTRFFLSRD